MGGPAKQVAEPTGGALGLLPGFNLGGSVLAEGGERFDLPEFAPITQRSKRFRTNFHILWIAPVCSSFDCFYPGYINK